MAGHFLADMLGVPFAIATTGIAMIIIGGIAGLIATPSNDRTAHRPDALDTICIELRAIARAHLRLTEALRVCDATNSCLPLLQLTRGSSDQSVIEGAVLIQRHLSVLLQRYHDTVRLALPNEIALHASRLFRGVVDLGTIADHVRLGMLKAAGDAFDVELRYVRSQTPDPTLSPVTERTA